MTTQFSLKDVYAPSRDIVAREIEGEIIIVPLTAGIGNLEDELFTLNESAKAVWRKLDGKRPLNRIIAELSEEFDADAAEIEKDVAGLLDELLKRKILVRTSHA